MSNISDNIRKYYLFNLLSGTFFAVPIIVLFFQENGLNLFEVMLLQTIFAIAIVLLEVPTGYFADIHGRKPSLFFGAFFIALGGLVYALSYGFFGFLIAELLFAIGLSLFSGADSAFVYDTLKEQKKEHMFKKIQGNAFFIFMMTAAVSNIFGGFIGQYDLRLTFWIFLPFTLLRTLITTTFVEPRRTTKIYGKKYIKNLSKIVKYALLENKKIRWLMMYSGLLMSFAIIAFWFYQPYFVLTGLDIIYFGIVIASYNIISALSAKYAHEIERFLGQRKSLILVGVLTVLSFLLFGLIASVFGFLIGYMMQFRRGFLKIITSDYINRLVPSDRRATVLSIESLIGRLIFSVFSPFLGWFADVYSLQQAFLLSALIVFVLGGVFLFFLKRDNVI